MGIQDLISQVKRVETSDRIETKPTEDSDDEIVNSLELLIERDNPMAEAAQRALNRL
ncbi:hypothetical protein [Halovenus salina]|uniref:Uncharacterized protein n=1 Tax=Halovenus salina TaxID=1510225 RepID=A0ABD5W117_9EURY|nr:hypothetical protein [Halovenus salina]